MKNWIVVLGAALVLMLAGCGGGGNGGGSVTPPPPPPPPPTPTALTVTLTPVSVDLDQAAKPASGSIFIGQQATIKVTQGTATITNATLTASAGTINQSTFTAPGSAATVTISAKGTDGATGSATISVVKPDVPAVVAAKITNRSDTFRKLAFDGDGKIIAGGYQSFGPSNPPGATVYGLDPATMQTKVKDYPAPSMFQGGTQFNKIAVFGGDNASGQPFLASFDASATEQKTASCGFQGKIQSMGYDPSMNAFWLAIWTPNQLVLALADAVNFQINCSSVYQIVNSSNAINSEVLPFSGGIILTGHLGIQGGAMTYVIIMDRNGNKIAETDYDGTDASHPMLLSPVAVGPVDENGSTFIYVAATKLSTGTLYVQKFDTQAKPAWSHAFEWDGGVSPVAVQAMDIVVNPKGGVIIGGGSTKLNNTFDINLKDGIIVGVKSDGTSSWGVTRLSASPSVENSSFFSISFTSMGITPDGLLWVGTTFQPFQKNYYGGILKVALP